MGELLHFGGAETTSGGGGGAEADARGTESAALVGRNGVGVEGEADEVEGFFVEFAVDAETRSHVGEDEVVFGAAALKDETEGFEFVGEDFGVFDDFFSVVFKFGF